ncbi:MAG TPA: hypothetical protein VFC84_02260 [Desulfosporosinus sp.]|nr:hypothetical protein [Desulfosporosinus sp.]
MSSSTVLSGMRMRNGSKNVRACVTRTRLTARTGKCGQSVLVRSADRPNMNSRSRRSCSAGC